jgi:hypothetical protein
MNGRIYDPHLARFISPDPIIQSPYNGQNRNRYAYVLNNPLKYTDPSGYQAVFETGGFGGNYGGAQNDFNNWANSGGGSGGSSSWSFSFGGSGAGLPAGRFQRALPAGTAGGTFQNANIQSSWQVVGQSGSRDGLVLANQLYTGSASSPSVYVDSDKGRGFEVIRQNSGKKIGEMAIYSRGDAQRVLYALGKPFGNSDVFRAKLAIYAKNDPEGYAKNTLRLRWVSESTSLVTATSQIGFRTGVGTAFTPEIVNTVSSQRTITVIGSMRDVAKDGYHLKDGFNTLRVGTYDFMTPAAFDVINRNFMKIAIERGDDFWLVTNPAAHRALSVDKGFQSRFIDLEIPMLESARNVIILSP